MPSPHYPSLPTETRLFCAAAALVTTCGLVAALLASWERQADPVWLSATPAVLAEVATCDREPTRLERVRCKEAIVATRVPFGQGPVPMASR